MPRNTARISSGKSPIMIGTLCSGARAAPGAFTLAFTKGMRLTQIKLGERSLLVEPLFVNGDERIEFHFESI